MVIFWVLAAVFILKFLEESVNVKELEMADFWVTEQDY
jgi:hypothetical protein